MFWVLWLLWAFAVLHSGNSQVSLSLSWSGAKSANPRGKITGYFPGIPGGFQVYPQNTPVFAGSANFGPKPASDSERIGFQKSLSDSAQSPENLMVSPETREKTKGRERFLAIPNNEREREIFINQEERVL